MRLSVIIMFTREFENSHTSNDKTIGKTLPELTCPESLPPFHRVYPTHDYLHLAGSTPLELITSYTALVGRLTPLPKWVGQGVVLGLQGGTASVMNTITNTVERQWGNLSDVAGVWLQDWTGQRNFTGKNDLPRVGLWWNWEVVSPSVGNSQHCVCLCVDVCMHVGVCMCV